MVKIWRVLPHFFRLGHNYVPFVFSVKVSINNNMLPVLTKWTELIIASLLNVHSDSNLIDDTSHDFVSFDLACMT